MAETAIHEKAKAAEVRAKKPKMLKDLLWTCHTCENDAEGNYKKFLQVALSGEE